MRTHPVRVPVTFATITCTITITSQSGRQASSMKLGLATHLLPRDPAREIEPGVLQMSQQKHAVIKVINVETGEVVDDIAGFVWGPGKNFAGAIEAPGLFDSEHFEEGKDYVIIAFPCEFMQECEKPPS